MVASLLLGGCGDQPEPPATSTAEESAHRGAGVQSLSISLPQQETPNAIALGSSDSLHVGSSAVITERIRGLATVSSTGNALTKLDRASKVGNVWSGGAVKVGREAVVEGFINSGGGVVERDGATIGGPIVQTPVTAHTDLTTWEVVFPRTQGDVVVHQRGSRRLAPGAFGRGEVKGGGELTLSAGTYFFNSLKTHPGAKLLLDESAAPIFVYVLWEVGLQGKLVHQGGDEGDLLVGCVKCSEVTLQSPFLGTLVVPKGKIVLGSGRPTPSFPGHHHGFGHGSNRGFRHHSGWRHH
jgi:hypothetical protein